MQKVAVILYGPPGSGKGTQAYLLNRAMDLMHVDAGQAIEAVVHDPKNRANKAIQKERALFDAGKLVGQKFVLKLMKKLIAEVAHAGFGVILSGQPRRADEADILLPFLEKLYGKKNIYFFVLKVPESVSLQRNSNRMICKTCGMPFLAAYAGGGSGAAGASASAKKHRHCLICGGQLRKRTVDSPAVIHVRLEEYRKQTRQVFVFTRARGYQVHEINALPAPAKVFEQIMKRLGHRAVV